MNRLRTRRALVWGSRGFIGRHLVGDLIERGWDVTVLARPDAQSPPPWANVVEWITFQPANPGRAFDDAVAGASVIFNLAGSSGAVASNRDPIDSLESNCRLQLEFLGACERAARVPHVVFASSRLVYAIAGRQPVTEDHPVAPASMYAAHKLCVESYHRIFAQRGAITFTVCRISNPYGVDAGAPAKGYGFINALIQRALAGERISLFGRGLQLRDYLYIVDLVEVLRLCAERREATNELFNIGFGTSIAIGEAAAVIQRRLGGGSIDFQPWPKEYEAVESGDFVVDVRKARALLGFSPAHDFAAGIDDVRTRAMPEITGIEPGGLTTSEIAARR